MATATENKPKAAAKPKAAPKAPKFGGTVTKPELGANGRRLWAFLKNALPKKTTDAIREKALAAVPEGDRFVRWENLVEVCATMPGVKEIEVGSGDDKKTVKVDKALVTKLSTTEGAKELGVKTEISIYS